MGFTAAKCPQCGADIQLDDSREFGFCNYCGTKVMQEKIVVEHQGSVKVDNTDYVKKFLQNAQRALAKEDWEEVEKYYNLVEQNVPNNMEAVFFSSYGKAMLSLTDSDYFKREQKFGVLNRSMSVISDYYELTTENKEEVLRKISNYIKKMYTVTFVYQRQSIDVAGALRAVAGVTGSKQWCINLLNSTKMAFLTELQQIAEKHDEEFLKELMIENGVNTTPSPQQSQNNKNVPDTTTDSKMSTTSIILGIIGIVMAWLLAIIGWIVGGTALGFAIAAKKKSEGKAKTALIISIIAIVCSFISSVIGAAMMS